MTRRSAAKTAEAVSGQPPSDQEAELDVRVQPIRIPTPDFQSANDGADATPDFQGDFDKLMTYHKQKVESDIIEKANLKRRIIELEGQLKKAVAIKHAKGSSTTASKSLKQLSKKDRQLAAKDILKKYFSEAQINYLIDFKGEAKSNEDIVKAPKRGGPFEKPQVRWSPSDLNKFAKLKAHIRIVGYNYIRRMNIVPMPSLNILQRAHREGKLEPETVELMERKMRARMANGSVPKSGSVEVYMKEEDNLPANHPPPPKRKVKVDPVKPTSNEPTPEQIENRRQLSLVMAAIQDNNMPSIIIRKKHQNPADNSVMFEERALFTPHHGQRTGDWNDVDFDTVLQKRSVTGYNRRPNTLSQRTTRVKEAKAVTDPKLITEPESEDESAVITYDEEGNAYTLKKEDSGQITIIEQQAAINSITAPGGHAVQVQTVPLSQATTSVPGGLGTKQQLLQIGTIGNNQVVFHPISGQDTAGAVTLITQNSPNSFEFRADQLVSAGGSGAPTQVVYTTTDDGQMIQSHYQTVGYTTTAVETAESQEQEITF